MRRRAGDMHFIAKRRCVQLGRRPVFAETENPLPWMSETMDPKREKNFLESCVIEHQNGGASTGTERPHTHSALRTASRRAVLLLPSVPLVEEVKLGMRYGEQSPMPQLPPQL